MKKISESLVLIVSVVGIVVLFSVHIRYEGRVQLQIGSGGVQMIIDSRP